MIVTSGRLKQCLNFIGQRMHAPEQKIVLTATALGIQPIIDMKNKNVDKETRKVSTARTIAKIIAGAITGITIRYAGIAAIKKLTQHKPIVDKLGNIIGFEKGAGILFPRSLLNPKKLQGIKVQDFENGLSEYIKGAGTLLATATMLITNFTCDVPWTNKLTPPIYKALFKKDLNEKKEKTNPFKPMYIDQRPKVKNAAFAQMERHVYGQ